MEDVEESRDQADGAPSGTRTFMEWYVTDQYGKEHRAAVGTVNRSTPGEPVFKYRAENFFQKEASAGKVSVLRPQLCAAVPVHIGSMSKHACETEEDVFSYREAPSGSDSSMHVCRCLGAASRARSRWTSGSTSSWTVVQTMARSPGVTSRTALRPAARRVPWPRTTEWAKQCASMHVIR